MNPPNWDKLFDRLATANVPAWDKDAIGVGILEAYDKWAERDAAVRTLIGTELAGQEPVPYKIDIAMRGENGIVLVDWKTKWTGQLDDRWEMRETRSPQRKIYAAAAATLYGSDVFPIKYEVRGLRLGDTKPKTKTLEFVISEGEAAEAVRHVRDVEAMRRTLIERGEYPWPRHDPGCQIYGPMYKCEFEDICWAGMRVPPTDLVRIEKPFSHSSVKEFMRCPERYRLLRSFDRIDEEDEGIGANVSGHLFHELMESLYKDLFGTNSPLITS